MRQQPSAEYRGFRMAGIRLSEDIVPELESHRSTKMGPTMEAVHQFDKAHLTMLTEEGLIPRRDGVAMLRAIRQMEAAGVEKVRLEVEGGKHSGEQFLIRRLGEEVGGRIHLGRSSGDLGEVGRRIAEREKLRPLMAALNDFRGTLLDLAERHADTVMPGYTHGQHAQPTTFGHWLSMWACVFARDFARLAALYRRVNLSPAGAAILTGSDFPLNRRRTAELLGFDEPFDNTMDAILSHDIEMECACALAVHAANMGRLADDLMLWSSSEFNLIDVPDRFCGTSSIMMQKKNPYAPQEMKGLAAEALGAAVTACMVEKGATGLPILEHQYMERGLWSVFGLALRHLQWANDLFPALIVHRERMRELAGGYWAQAADVAGALVRDRGLPWRSAHQIVGILVRHSYERGLRPNQTTPEMVDEAAVEYMGEPVGLSAASLAAALDPVACVQRRTLYGGPAPDAMRRELGPMRTVLAADRGFVEEVGAHTAAAARRLEQAIDDLLATADD